MIIFLHKTYSGFRGKRLKNYVDNRPATRETGRSRRDSAPASACMHYYSRAYICVRGRARAHLYMIQRVCMQQ